MTTTFASRFAAARAARGPRVWGLAPAGKLLEDGGLGAPPAGPSGAGRGRAAGA